MKITFDHELIGIESWEVKMGDIVEVLKAEKNGELRGEICIVSGGAGSRIHLVALSSGEIYPILSDMRFRLLDAELLVKAYEGR